MAYYGIVYHFSPLITFGIFSYLAAPPHPPALPPLFPIFMRMLIYRRLFEVKISISPARPSVFLSSATGLIFQQFHALRRLVFIFW